MQHALSFYAQGQLRTDTLIRSGVSHFLSHLRGETTCYLTRGGNTWDYHFVVQPRALADGTLILEALNILEARVYLADAEALFLPPEALPDSHRAALANQLERGAQLHVSTAHAELLLHEQKITITTFRIGEHSV